MFLGVLEKPLEKKAGRNFGPPGSKKLVYFIDDMNMPEVDTYGTVQPHTLIRQHMDYKCWYDRTKLSLKEVHNCQYVSCMNPTAGSFTINSRLQVKKKNRQKLYFININHKGNSLGKFLNDFGG